MAIAPLELEVPGRRRLRLLEPPVAGQPTLPGRRRPSARVAGRRRVALGALATVTVLSLAGPLSGMIGRVVGAAGVGGAGGAVAGGRLPLTVRAGQGTYYVVRAGDTLASIAARVAPSDPGAELGRLTSQLGSGAVVPGEHVRLG